MISNKHLVWTYWFITACLLLAGLSGYFSEAIPVAIALAAVQVVHFGLRTRSLTSFPVQVRFAYLGMLIAGMWWPLGFIHWIQLFGTWAMVLVGYCPLARTMSLMPWNRDTPLSPRAVAVTFFSAPVQGSVQNRLRPAG